MKKLLFMIVTILALSSCNVTREEALIKNPQQHTTLDILANIDTVVEGTITVDEMVECFHDLLSTLFVQD